MAEIFFKAKLAEVEAANAAPSDEPKVIPNSSQAIAKMLDEITKVAQEAQNAATAASTAAELAKKHVQDSLVN